MVQLNRPQFSSQQILAIRCGKEFLWVYGFIEYEDAFGNGYCRKFCNRLYVLENGNGYVRSAQDPSTPPEYTQGT